MQVARGALKVGVEFGEPVLLQAGDGAAVEGEQRIALQAETASEALIFDLA